MASVHPDGSRISPESLKQADSNPYTWRDRLYSLYLFYRVARAVPKNSDKQVVFLDWKACQEANRIISTKMSCEDLNRRPKRDGAVRICAVSDTHERHELLTIPQCDVLVHTGDILFCGRKQSTALQLRKLKDFDRWLAKTPSRHRLVVGGNHDLIMQDIDLDEKHEKAVFSVSNAVLLHNKNVLIEGLRFGGTPYSEGISRNRAFQNTDVKDKALLSLRDSNVDVFLSHSDDLPPKTMNIRPRLWLWGHHHNRWGAVMDEGVVSLCSSIMDHSYCPSNPPIVVEL